MRPSVSAVASSASAAEPRDGDRMTFPGWPAVLGALSAGDALQADVARAAMSEIMEMLS